MLGVKPTKIINTPVETVRKMEDNEAILNYVQIKYSGCYHRA